MSTSFPVRWRERGGLTYAGKLEVHEDRFVLVGTGSDGQLARLTMPYEDVVAVRIGRALDERINGARSLVIERHGRAPIQIGAIEGIGSIFDIGDLLAELTSEKTTPAARIAVVLPLKPGAQERARLLIAHGPPFEPASASFEHHHVFLNEQEVIFVFEGPEVKRAVRELARKPSVWKAGAAWRECLAGRPRLAEERYSWTRSSSAPVSAGRRGTTTASRQ